MATSHLLTMFLVVCLASAFFGAIVEYVWHALRHNTNRRKGHRSLELR